MKRALLILLYLITHIVAFAQSTYSYQDNLNRIDSIIYPDSSWTKIVYDKAGNIISEKDYNICDKYSIPVITGMNHFCKNDSTILTSTPAAKYLWSTGDTTRSIVVKSGGNYTVTIIYANECDKKSALFTVNVDSLPNAAITGLAAGCNSVTLVATGGTHYIWYGGTNWTSTNTVTTTGTYTVFVFDANNCKSTISKAVTIYPNPNVTITGPASSCSSVSLTAGGGNSYSWNGGNSRNTATNIFNISGTYTVTATDTNGCTASLSKSVTVYSLPSVNILGATTACGSVTLTATGSGTYFWSGGTTPTLATNTFTASGTYTLTVTNSNGCTNTRSVSVIVNPNPIAIITGPSSGCGSVALTASGGSSYRWNGGSSLSSATNTFTSSGIYTVTVTGANGCTATATKSVTVNAVPTASITGPDNGCGSVILTASGGTTYLWYSGSSRNTASDTFYYSGNYGVTVTSAAGCSSFITKNITVNPNPVINISGSTTACEKVTLTAIVGAYSSCLWNGGTSPYSSIDTFTTTGTYTLIVTSLQGCTSSANIAVTIKPLPVISILGDPIGCDSVTLTANGGANYLWSGGSYPNSPTNIFATTGIYTVTVTGMNGCVANKSALVTIKDTASPILSVNTTCLSNNPVLSLTYVHNIVQIKWLRNDTIISIVDSTGKLFIPTIPGVYNAIVTYLGCAGTISVTTNEIKMASAQIISIIKDQLQLCAPYGLLTYLWNTAETTRCINITTPGIYSVSAKDRNSCTVSTSINVPVINCNKMHGSYTIGGRSGKFNTPAAAITAMYQCGADGPITFVVTKGNYYDLLNFPDTIPGVNAVNTVTFVSENNATDSVKFYGDTILAYHLKMSNTKYVSFVRLQFEIPITGGTHIKLYNNDNITFNGCIFNSNPYPPMNGHIVQISKCNNCDFSNNIIFVHNPLIQFNFDSIANCTISNNIFEYVYIKGVSKSIKFQNNNMYDVSVQNSPENFYIIGNIGQSIHVYNLKHSLIDLNTLSSGLYCESGSTADTISRNNINHKLLVWTGDSIQITNNMIVGFLTSNSNHTNIYHNSVYTPSNYFIQTPPLQKTDTTVASITGTSVKCKNNIFKSRSDSIFCCKYGTGVISDYNIYAKTANGFLLRKNNINYSTLSSFQLTGQDAHSLTDTVRFVSGTDLHISGNGIPDSSGTQVGIYNDIDGQVRNPLKPDIGADEFNSFGLRLSSHDIKDTVRIRVDEDELLLYPNPAESELNIDYNGTLVGPFEISIYSVSGQILFKDEIADLKPKYKIDISEYSKAEYIFKLKIGNRIFKSKRFVKQ